MGWNIVIQYIIYGAICIVGLIVLYLMRRYDRRPNMLVALEKTEKCLKLIEKMLNERSHMNIAYYTQLENWLGDLVVLAEKEVVGNRNVTFDGVLNIYKASFALLDDPELVADKNRRKIDIETIEKNLEQAQGLLKDLT